MLSLTDSHAWQVTYHFSASSLPFVTQLFPVQRVSDRTFAKPQSEWLTGGNGSWVLLLFFKTKAPFHLTSFYDS